MRPAGTGPHNTWENITAGGGKEVIQITFEFSSHYCEHRAISLVHFIVISLLTLDCSSFFYICHHFICVHLNVSFTVAVLICFDIHRATMTVRKIKS